MTTFRDQLSEAGKGTVFKGTFLNPTGVPGADLETYDPGWLSVGSDGRIVSLTRQCPKNARQVVDFGTALVVPGFVDTHTHLAQYAFTGLGDLPLLPWLDTYTFPHERAFADANLARAHSRFFFQACLASGTTTVMAYGTSHAEAVHIAFEEARALGIRAGLGLMLMDRHAPADLLSEPGVSLAEADALAARWDHAGNGKLRFVVTPRFAVSCTQGLMEGAADLAKRRGLFVQTHLSENKEEIALVRELFPKAKSYTDVYDACGLLGPRTLLGHCLHLGADERAVLRERGCVVTHCASSNTFLASGLMPLARFLEEGLRVSLGTDVAGGTSLSMISEMKAAGDAARLRKALYGDELLKASSLLSLATLEGARAVGLEKQLGNFAAGKAADFVVIDDLLSHPLFPQLGAEAVASDTVLERLSRVLSRPHPDAVRETWIEGTKVFSRKGVGFKVSHHPLNTHGLSPRQGFAPGEFWCATHELGKSEFVARKS